MNYSPVADINSEPKNPVIGTRSFSDNPEIVGRYVAEQIKGYGEGGIASCVKHFPGHGDTSVDSHYALPEINKKLPELAACELIPFKRAVAENVDAVMTAHIRIHTIADAASEGENLSSEEATSRELPASLNPRAIEMLRKDFSYQGLIISDCLEMDGVRTPYGTENAAVMALNVKSPSLAHAITLTHTV